MLSLTLADNGGPTQTLAVLAGSPLIDAGNDAFVPITQTSDQLGGTHDRIFGAAVDIGAIEVQPPEVTIEQGATQLDPTNATSVTFDIVFDAAVDVLTFDGADIDLSASTVGGTLSSVITTSSLNPFASQFTLTVTGMSGEGLVIPVVTAGGATDASGEVNLGSTSIDNEVTFDNLAPSVTINQGALQNDPTNVPSIVFDILFSEDVVGFGSGNIDFTGTTASVFGSVVIQNGPGDYTLTVFLNPGEGDVVVSIQAGEVTDVIGNLNVASTFTDNTVHFDDVAPTVTVNQASTQTDAGYGSTVKFDVVFSESVVGFVASPAQMSFAGSTATGSFTTSVSGSGAAYVVTVSGFTAGGTVVANILGGSVADTAGNFNVASTSTDNNVTLINSGTVQFSAPTYTVNENGTTATITVTRTGGTEGELKVDYATVLGGTATSPADYVGATATGTLTFAAGSAVSQDILITINDDTDFEGNETVNLALSNVTVDLLAAAGALGTPSTAVLTIDDFEAGTLSFSAPNYFIDETTGLPIAAITVTRTLGSDGAVGATYSIANGTALLGSDYSASATPNPLTWLAGDATSRTIVIPITNDTLNEGNETILLGLGTITGGALTGITSAVANILPSDGIKIDASTSFKAISFLDQDSDKVKVSFGGNSGSAEVFRTDPDGDGKGPIELIVLTGTDPLKSTLTVAVTKAAKKINPTADGRTSIGTVIGTGLKKLTAKASDLIGLGINVGTDYLGSVSVMSIRNGADIVAGGTNLQKTSIAVGPGKLAGDGTISTGSDITLGSILFSLKATSYDDVGVDSTVNDITAPRIGTITIKANFGAEIDVSGAGVDHLKKKNSLGKLDVRGVIDGSNMNVIGNIGTVSSYGFLNSRLFGGYVGNDIGTTPLGFAIGAASPTTIKTFKTLKNKTLTGTFANSSVIASVITNATLANVTTANAGDAFGIFAKSFETITTTIGGVKTTTKDSAAFTAVGDFDIAIV